MIFLISLLSTVCCFLFLLFVFYLQQRNEGQVRQRLQNMIKKSEYDRIKKIGLQPELSPSRNSSESFFYRQYIAPIFDRLDKYFNKFVPAKISEILEEKIFQAGKTGIWSLPRVMSFWFITTLIGVASAVFLTGLIHLHFLQEALIILFGIFSGAIFPLLRLNHLIDKRQKEIREMLPEFLDLLCVSVQAGLSFDGAIAKIIPRMSGPLIDEFRKMQNDISLGMTHKYALNQIARRCNLEEMYLFTAAVIQSEKLGTSMGKVLKNQADNMRDRQRQFIKAESMKAPIKIIFPMIIFIFPAIFIVLLLPPILTFIRTMGG